MRNTVLVIPLFQSFTSILFFYPGATHLASLGACPWLSYFAPLALRLVPLALRLVPLALRLAPLALRLVPLALRGLITN